LFLGLVQPNFIELPTVDNGWTQLMMMAYNLFLLFKMDFAKGTEYRRQIKTFRLKYIFLAGKIIRTARNIMMKFSENYPYQEIHEKSLA